jgi:hypothetical protein
MVEGSPKCVNCKHLMIYHGVEEYKENKGLGYFEFSIGYCADGNDGDCKCKIKGLSYDEAIQLIK